MNPALSVTSDANYQNYEPLEVWSEDASEPKQ